MRTFAQTSRLQSRRTSAVRLWRQTRTMIHCLIFFSELASPNYVTWNMKKHRNIYQSRQPNVPKKPNSARAANRWPMIQGLVSLLSKYHVVKPWLEMLGTWLYIWYVFMYVLNICIQWPVKPGNLTQLYKKLRIPGIYQVELRPTWGRSPKVQAWHGFGDLWFGALFWTRLVSFGSETVQFVGGIVHFEPFSNDSWSVNHQPNMVIHTKNVFFSQKNCSPID